MNIEKRNIKDLEYAGYNPRKKLKAGDAEYEKIKRSVEHFGYVDPIIINADNTIIGGHQRLTVLKDLGYTEIDVVVVDLSKDDEKALNVALNKISGDWDTALLKDLLEELDSGAYDVSLTGFDDAEIESLMTQLHELEDVIEDDFDAEAEAEAITVPVTQRGDIWALGRHRLYCGDSTDDIAPLMQGEQANLVVTDPPYNVAYEGKTKERLTIQNDKQGSTQFYDFLLAAHKVMYEYSVDGATIYVFHADSEGLNFRRALIDSGYKLAQCCIWVKNSMVMGRQDYHWQHEPVLYGWKPTGAHKWHTDRKQTTVWNFDRPTVNKEHPTMKPVALVAYPIKNSSVANCIVLDPFGGSGTTLIACDQLGRIARLVELDEKYCDVIVKRYIKHKGDTSDITLERDGVIIPYEETGMR